MAIASEAAARQEQLEPRRANLALGRLLSTSFGIYLHRWKPHLAASIIAQGPVLVPTLMVIERLAVSMRDNAGDGSPEALALPIGLSFLLLFLAFVSSFSFVLMSGAACQLVLYWLHGRDVTVLGAYRVALHRFWRLAGSMLAVFLGMCLGLGALVGLLAFVYSSSLAVFQLDASQAVDDPRVLWLMLGLLVLGAVVSTAFLLDALVRWAVFVQAVIIEGAGPIAALARSAELVRGRWRRTAWAMILFMVLPLILMMVLGMALSLALAPLVAAGIVSEAVGNHLALITAQLALSPVAPIGVTVLFYALRDGDLAWDRIDAQLGSEGSLTATDRAISRLAQSSVRRYSRITSAPQATTRR